MAKIESISVTVARIPLDRTTSIARRTIVARDYCLVRVRSVDGTEGIGFCYVGNTSGIIAKVAVEELLAPLLIGQDSLQVEGLWERMYGEALLQGRAGSVMRAISILDIALWDLNARSVGLPLHKYMGCAVLEAVPAYASGGYYVDGKTPEMLAAELRGYVESGFHAVKMKVGRLSLAEEEKRIIAARKAIGDDVHLMLDANNAWTDIQTAMAYMKRYELYNPYWIEEPFSPDDIENHARLAEKTDVLVATGEIEVGRWRFKELLDKKAAVILQTDAAVCGGISEWRRIAQTAASYCITVSPHWFHDLHAPLVATMSNARYVEYFPDDQVLNFRKIINRQLQVANGELVLHRTPGLGFEFDEQAVAAYSSSRGDQREHWTVIH